MSIQKYIFKDVTFVSDCGIVFCSKYLNGKLLVKDMELHLNLLSDFKKQLDSMNLYHLQVTILADDESHYNQGSIGVENLYRYKWYRRKWKRSQKRSKNDLKLIMEF